MFALLSESYYTGRRAGNGEQKIANPLRICEQKRVAEIILGKFGYFFGVFREVLQYIPKSLGFRGSSPLRGHQAGIAGARGQEDFPRAIDRVQQKKIRKTCKIEPWGSLSPRLF